MNGWGWVLLGYGVVGAGLGAYTWSLLTRVRKVARQLDDLG